MYYAGFSFLALIILIIINYEILRNIGNIISRPKLRYRNFLLSVILFNVFEVIWGILYEEKLMLPLYFDSFVYFVSMFVSVILWCAFVAEYLNKRDFFGNLLAHIGWPLMAFQFLSLVINIYIPVVFGYDMEGRYFAGPVGYVTVGIEVILFSCASVYTLVASSDTYGKPKAYYNTIAASGIVMAVFSLLQFFYIMPPFYAVGSLIAICLVHTFVAEDARMDDAMELGSVIQQKRGQAERQELKELIHAQELIKLQSDAMITAMAAEYKSVYYVDLDKDECICYRANLQLQEGITEGEPFVFSEMLKHYADKYVEESYRNDFLDFIEPNNIRSRLEEENVIAFRYLCLVGGTEHYEMVRLSHVRSNDERGDDIIHAAGMGFSDVDRETRETIEKNRALSDALNQAEEANAAKTSFLSSMSHEIRTPMNAIIGFNTIVLKDNTISDTTREYLEKIGASAKHLLALINDILDMSRIESGRMTIRSEEFSFREMLEQINTMIRGQCQDKGLEYDCRINGEVAEYYIGDNMKLKQVLLNILGNAIKYTPAPGRIIFDVDQIASFGDNATLRFVVKDTGVGMDREFIPKVFSAFSQENEAGTTVYGSTGLGMAITKNIVEMMNGKINLESEKGVGSTFTVTVTLKNADRTGQERDDELRPQDMRVLIIDDDDFACAQAHMVLDAVGIISDVCHSGDEACDLITLADARQESYDLILVDLLMPGHDGVDVTRMIREKFDDNVAIFLLTGTEWDDIEEEAREAGIDDFLSKPLISDEAMDKFRHAINSKKLGIKEGRKVDLSGRRILLAEDMMINAEIMKHLLGLNNMEVEHAENGRICVDKFCESEPDTYDAILMDIRMPEMNGLEAAEAIRALDRPDAKTVPIIAMTANAFDEDVQRSLQAGMNAHLTKPVEANVLIETLQTLIGER